MGIKHLLKKGIIEQKGIDFLVKDVVKQWNPFECSVSKYIRL